MIPTRSLVHRLFGALLLVAMLMTPRPAAAQSASEPIRLNQIGFYPEAPKVAVAVDAPAGDFFVTTPGQTDTVFTGTLGEARTWPFSGETVRLADFSALRTPGRYVLAVPGLGHSPPFEIAPRVHQEVARGALKAYYFMRASTALPEAYAGPWARPAGHPDTSVIVHPSAASDGRPAGTRIAAPRGWYDAGDYNKYVVNAGISMGTLFLLYEQYPSYFEALNLNIPESGNDLPDLLDEALWNLRWMLKMQDPGDGGVYHKLTTPYFEGAVMPHQATQPRYVVQKSTAATLDFAAVMAQAARIYADYETALPGLADSCLTAARAAWDWAVANPRVFYDQNRLNEAYDPDVTTGQYGDGSFADEFRWAAAELYITTKTDAFVQAYPPRYTADLEVPSWPNVEAMGVFSLAHHRRHLTGAVDTTRIKERILRLADQLVAYRASSAFDVMMGGPGGGFFWGSNSAAANQGLVTMQAYRLTGDVRYLEAALANLDYLLGRNGTGYSFLTGYGHRTPMQPHHRPSEADGVPDPVPGLLVGGPHDGGQDIGPEPWQCDDYRRLPANSWIDDWCSYATNEITINWNAPMVYLAGALEATLSETGLPVGAVRPGTRPPRSFGLESYPNPTSTQATIRFALPDPRAVSLHLFDLLGREVAQVLDGQALPPGLHEHRLDTSRLPSGLYLLHLHTPDATRTHPLLVLR